VPPAAAEVLSLAEEQRTLVRQRVLRAARHVLATRGLDARVEDVADAAGLSRRTVFRYFPNRDGLLAAAVLDGIRSYGEHVPRPQEGRSLDEWLIDALRAVHGMNTRNGRGYWELALRRHLPGELAAAASARREAARRFVSTFSSAAWRRAGGSGRPPRWLVDTFAVHLSGFGTQTLVGDLGRTPEEASAVSAKALRAALDAALAERRS